MARVLKQTVHLVSAVFIFSLLSVCVLLSRVDAHSRRLAQVVFDLCDHSCFDVNKEWYFKFRACIMCKGDRYLD